MVSLFRTLFVRTVPPPSGVRRERRRRWSPAVVVNFAHVVERGLPYRPKTRNRYRSRILVSPPTPRFGPVSRRWSADVSVNEYVRSRGVSTATFVDNNNKKIHPRIVSRDHRQSCSSRLINRLSTPPHPPGRPFPCRGARATATRVAAAGVVLGPRVPVIN